MIAYFRLAVNPNDEEAFKRVLNYPARGIGDTTLGKIVATASMYGVSLWAVLCQPLTFGLNINKGTHTKLQGFRDLIEGFMTDAREKDAYEVGRTIVMQSGIMNDVSQDRTPENLSRQENLEELVNGMHDFCATREEEGNEHVSLTDYLAEVSLLTDQDSDKEEEGAKVTLMTIHSAKGLEFKNVFVVGLEENLFPSSMCGDSQRALEEERRLFYVAITRAEERCYLSYAKNRFKYGKSEFCTPSRFLKDIDLRYLSVPQSDLLAEKVDEGASRFRSSFEPKTSFSPRMKPVADRPKAQIIPPVQPARTLKKVSSIASSRPAASPSAGALQVGSMIEHERFGIGEVVNLVGTGDDCKATVKFRNAGEKQLLLKFARFKVIG